MKSKEAVNDEVQELVWALLDERASAREIARLESLLLEYDDARETYLHCIQMHIELERLINGRRPKLSPEIAKALSITTKGRPPMPLVNLPPIGTTLPLSEAFDL